MIIKRHLWVEPLEHLNPTEQHNCISEEKMLLQNNLFPFNLMLKINLLYLFLWLLYVTYILYLLFYLPKDYFMIPSLKYFIALENNK